jgi:hypothetical protein
MELKTIKKVDGLDLFGHYTEEDTVDELLVHLGLHMEDYIIAGGFYRDKLNNVPFKDVDVFLPWGDETLDEMPCGYDVKLTKEIEHAGVKINIISLNFKADVGALLKSFDLGICQIGRDAEGNIVASQAYLDDVANKTLTVLRNPETHYSEAHIKRVVAKYPDFQLIPYGQ